jgi:UDP-glucose 4-epimerase
MDIYGIRNLVFSSSAAIYGNPEYLPIDENHPTNPTNFYGYTKCQMEKTMEWYSMLGKIRYAALRYFNAAGYMRDGSIMEPENNPTNLLPVVMEVASERRGPVKIFGTDYDTVDGTGVRDYIHVEDLAQAHILAAQYLKDNRKDLIVNLGTEVGHSVMEVIHKADHATGVTIPYNVCPRRPGDPSTVIASSSKALETLGWRAEYSSLEEIISSMWNVYRSL